MQDFTGIGQILTGLAAVLAVVQTFRIKKTTDNIHAAINGGVQRDLEIALLSAKSLYLLSKTDADKTLMDQAESRLNDHIKKMVVSKQSFN